MMQFVALCPKRFVGARVSETDWYKRHDDAALTRSFTVVADCSFYQTPRGHIKYYCTQGYLKASPFTMIPFFSESIISSMNG